MAEDSASSSVQPIMTQGGFSALFQHWQPRCVAVEEGVSGDPNPSSSSGSSSSLESGSKSSSGPGLLSLLLPLSSRPFLSSAGVRLSVAHATFSPMTGAAGVASEILPGGSSPGNGCVVAPGQGRWARPSNSRERRWSAVAVMYAGPRTRVAEWVPGGVYHGASGDGLLFVTASGDDCFCPPGASSAQPPPEGPHLLLWCTGTVPQEGPRPSARASPTSPARKRKASQPPPSPTNTPEPLPRGSPRTRQPASPLHGSVACIGSAVAECGPH
eukprot:RCo049916